MATTVKLSKPVTVGDKAVEEISLDVDSITGADIMFCVNEAAADKGVIVAYRIDTDVHLQMLAKLSGIDRVVLTKMNGRDFMALMRPVQDFFLGSD